MKKLLLFLFAVSCAGGSHQDPAPNIRPQKGAELCGNVCEKALHMENADGGVGCIIAEPVPDANGDVECSPDSGTRCVTCEAWCVSQHENGIFWNTECIMRDDVTRCEQIESVCNIQ